MDSNNIALSALAMDLKRIAILSHRGSQQAAARFLEEAQKRASEVDSAIVPDYIKKILHSLEQSLEEKNENYAEDALMYSTIIQNYCTSQ